MRSLSRRALTTPRLTLAGLIVTAILGVVPLSAAAQPAPTLPSQADNCSAIAQSASNGLQARIAADDSYITPPTSVTTLSCLDNFFSGTGLNLITSLLDPTTLLKSVEGQICSAVKSSWNSLLGSAHCGLTLTGFNIGFGGLGGGNFCPKLSFGGGGPTIGSIGLGTSNSGALSVSGSATVPPGYTAPSTQGLW